LLNPLFTRSARTYLRSQPNNVRSKLVDDIVELANDPYLSPDDPSKRPFLAPPAVMTKWQDDLHWVIYYVQRDDLMVANIGDRGERQSPVRA